MLRFKTRYKFWYVLAGVVCMGIFFFILYSISNNITKSTGKSLEGFSETEPEKHEEGTYIGAPFMFLYIVSLFYFALNYYYNLVVENKKLLPFLKITAVLVLASYIYHLILYYLIPPGLKKEYESPGQIFTSLFSYLIPILIICFLFAYITNMREAVKQRRILQAQKLLLEAQISQANFNFLKAQINPHFLHNTLNFLYSKSLPYSAELSEGILTLSDIMRYALSQGNQKDGKAPLKDEIEHVQNVIKISQLRFSSQLKVNFEVGGNVEGRMIIPFVLITIVENAFKHGDLKNPDFPVDIKVNVNGNKLYFCCRNKKKTGPEQISTGIGLENIKTRLHLAYGEKYNFIVKDEPEFYTTELTINEL